MTEPSANGATAATGEPKMNYFHKLWEYRRYLVIEPFFFFYFMASVFNAVAMQNFPLEKACHVNLGYNSEICTAMINKTALEIDCTDIEDSLKNTTMGATPDQLHLSALSPTFNFTVCKAEVEAQILTADISGKRAPIAAIFPLIILVFAGGWADKYNKRVPCMLLPVIGEALSFASLLISAIFFDELPMEFGAYLEVIVPSLFGGLTFCLMGVYSYITIATPEEDRVFRFGIFAMFVTGAPLFGVFSGVFFDVLGYVASFTMALIFQIIAILYIVFFLKEIKTKPKTPATSLPNLAADNLAYEATNLDELPAGKNVNFQLPTPTAATAAAAPPMPAPAEKRRSLLRELFDPMHVIECLRFPTIVRENNGRLLLNLLIFAYLLSVSPYAAEISYLYLYTRLKLGWDGNDFSIFSTLSGIAAVLGTFIGTAILSKMLKFSDSVIGMLSAACIVLARVLYYAAKTSAAFYGATVVEMFISMRVIAIKTIASSIVSGDELGKMYAIFGISEPIGQFIFPPLYSWVYTETAATNPGVFFLFGEIFYVPNVLVFVLCYFIVRRRQRQTPQNSVDLAQSNEQNAQAASGMEITNL